MLEPELRKSYKNVNKWRAQEGNELLAQLKLDSRYVDRFKVQSLARKLSCVSPEISQTTSAAHF